MGRLDRNLQALIVLSALRWLTLGRGIEASARDVEDAAQQSQWEVGSHGLHLRVPGDDSLAKYAVVGSTGHYNSSDLMAYQRRIRCRELVDQDCHPSRRKVDENLTAPSAAA